MREKLIMLDNSVEQEIVPSAPDLSAFRIISERGGSLERFSARDRMFNGQFTHERARNAFEDYKSLRDQLDKANRRKNLQKRLSMAQNGNRKAIEDQIRRNEFAYNPQGGEVIFVCADFEEAQTRVMELIGPVEFSKRHYRTERPLGDRKDKHETPLCTGFSTKAEFGNNGKSQIFKRRWRIDWDETKGPHFNVIINPGAPISGGFLEDRDSETLKVVLAFPGDKQTYEKKLQEIELCAITSMVNEDTTGHSLDYLGERK
jgi:hypothetical protein